MPSDSKLEVGAYIRDKVRNTIWLVVQYENVKVGKGPGLQERVKVENIYGLPSNVGADSTHYIHKILTLGGAEVKDRYELVRAALTQEQEERVEAEINERVRALTAKETLARRNPDLKRDKQKGTKLPVAA